jgi:nicotinate-nucleotide pyrophosphorylase (carboxylating)
MTAPAPISPPEALLRLAVEEDLGAGDITSCTLLPRALLGSAVIMAREELIVCGQAAAACVFHLIDETIVYTSRTADGVKVPSGEVIAEITGPLIGILSGERVALNFLQRLAGIATQTARIVERVTGYRVKVLDTRKTTPGWRALEKYAVRVGGGTNHRFGLWDAVLIKNNHIDALRGGISEAVEQCRKHLAPGVKVGVEVRNTNELTQALAASPDAILLDNMSPTAVSGAVRTVRERSAKIEIEASGGIDADNIEAYAAAGVDSVSLGMLTHSVKAADIALRYRKGA